MGFCVRRVVLLAWGQVGSPYLIVAIPILVIAEPEVDNAIAAQSCNPRV